MARARWIVAGLLILFIAYAGGRAAGILLDVNPYVTEIAAVLVVVVAAAFVRNLTNRSSAK